MTTRRATQQPTHGESHCGYARGIWLENRRSTLRELFCVALANSFSHADTPAINIHRFASIPLTQQAVLTIPIDHSIDPAVYCFELY